ncbi:MAG: hypothetical protein A4E57_02217 [Syntrophorhabdaceae bacterium PtaU1.Bin034]|jgi:hypothetical protein|nr:MAG: hypothetical protein A4E57_02217 [Syntrophorhabdaceae bacterium PtaU1.Bin034]
MMTAREALDESIREIRVKIEQHELLLTQLEEGSNASVLNCDGINCRHSRLLKDILLETVEVLENSRKAFKSKDLELLRKKLIRVLADST